MRQFDYTTIPDELLAPEIANLVSTIHEYRGRQDLYLQAKPETLDALQEVAIIQSTKASNAIEGIHTGDAALVKLMSENTAPRNRAEEEIAGYRDVLATIHENYPYINVTPGVILQLHRDLYRHSSASIGGRWKDSDNSIVEYNAKGNPRIRFKPTPALQTPAAIDDLCRAYNDATERDTYDPLVLSAMFVFDFVCIHPFNDGNGRMSRLLTLLTLYRANYLVGRYVSGERIIEESKETYYEALAASSTGWQDGTNTYAPFVRYQLGIVLAAYREFESRMSTVDISLSTGTKAQRVREVFDRRLGKITKRDILAECPDTSAVTVERALKAMLDAGEIEKVGAGRSTGYILRR